MSRVLMVAAAFTTLASCATTYVAVGRMESPQGAVITELTLADAGSQYDIPLLSDFQAIGQRYVPTRRITAPKGYELLVLRGGITNGTDQEMTVRLNEFVLRAGGKEYEPAAHNIKNPAVWAVSLGKRGDKKRDDGWDIYLAYVVPAGTTPESLILDSHGSVTVPPQD